MVIAVILFSLAAMVYQDIKFRKIHILFPIIVFISGSYLLLDSQYKSLSIIKYNSLFFIIVFCLLIGYTSIKNRKYINPFKNYFGLGDVLFFLAISPLFFLRNYVIFFILSMLFSIVIAFLFKRLSNRGIPLAGNSSFLLFILICGDLLLNNFSVTLLK